MYFKLIILCLLTATCIIIDDDSFIDDASRPTFEYTDN